MNSLGQLKDIGTGRRIFLIGNGPSLADMDMDRLKGETTIAMNRIPMLYHRTTWRPTYYFFCSSNCCDPRWGNEWSKSIHEACECEETTPFVWSQFREAIEARAGKLHRRTQFFRAITERGAGNIHSFSTDANATLDKSGTSMNVALQLAYYMGFDKTYLIGCDSNWKSATNTTQTGDPNHFDTNYQASIADGAQEFRSVNSTHEIAAHYFQTAGKEIYNAGENSAITAYEKIELNSILK